jgi:hypothetical protein
MPTTTRASAESDAYKHSLETLLGLAPDSNVHKALQENGLDQFSLLANIEADDLEDLHFTIPDLPPTIGTLNLGQKKHILLLKWFYVVRWQQAHNNGDTFTPSSWLLLTLEEFTTFKSHHGATITRSMTRDEVLQAILGGTTLAQASTPGATTLAQASTPGATTLAQDSTPGATILAQDSTPVATTFAQDSTPVATTFAQDSTSVTLTSSSDILPDSNFQRGHKRDVPKSKQIRDYAPHQAAAIDDGEKIALLLDAYFGADTWTPTTSTWNDTDDDIGQVLFPVDQDHLKLRPVAARGELYPHYFIGPVDDLHSDDMQIADNVEYNVMRLPTFDPHDHILLDPPDKLAGQTRFLDEILLVSM